MMAAAGRVALRAGLTWLFAVAAAFLLLRQMPGDPVELFLAEMNVRAGPETVAAYRAAWGLDADLGTQFVRWLSGFPMLDWGPSFETGRPVASEFADRWLWSAAIGFGGMTLALVLGVGLGFLAALRPGGAADVVSRALAVVGQALPAFAVGLVMLWAFAVQLRWISPFGGDPAERLILPIALVALFSVGAVARLARAGFAEVRASPFYVTALAKGRSRAGALWRHGARHAALPLIAGVAPELAWLVGGTAVAEIVFGVPGLSERVVDAVAHRDYAVLQAYVALVALWIAVFLAGAALLRAALDPRPA